MSTDYMFEDGYFGTQNTATVRTKIMSVTSCEDGQVEITEFKSFLMDLEHEKLCGALIGWAWHGILKMYIAVIKFWKGKRLKELLSQQVSIRFPGHFAGFLSRERGRHRTYCLNSGRWY